MPPKRKREPRTRGTNWVFTLNNYTEDDVTSISKWKENENVNAVYFGREIGENGTPHLQGMMQTKSKIEFSVIKQLLPRAHWEKMKGTWKQSLDYCSKESDLEGFGEAAEQGVPRNRNEMVKDIIAGETSETKLMEKFGGTYLSVYKG